MQIEIDEQSAQQIHDLASIMHTTAEQALRTVVRTGVWGLRREAFYRDAAIHGDINAGFAALERMGRGRTPDPGDEL